MNEKTTAGLYAKMSRTMGRLERLPKRGYNPHFKYNFVTDADVLDAVRAAMAAEGLALFVSMTGVQQEDKRTLAHFLLTFADGESGQSESITWVGEAIDTQDKGLAKAAASAVKYCLLKTFLIATGDEPDSDEDGPSPPSAKKAGKSPPESRSAGNGLDSLLEDVNAILLEKALDTYGHIEHLKNALKMLDYTGYKPSLHEEMVEKLVARKLPPPDQEDIDAAVLFEQP